MSDEKIDVLMLGPMMPLIAETLAPHFRVHRLWEAPEHDALLAALAPRLRAMTAIHAGHPYVDGAFMEKFPKLEIIASFGVGYDHVDAVWAGQHGIVVTNTPDVLTEEVADTALGLLLATVRELPQAERHLRAGKWLEAPYRLSPATLRDRTVGMVGLGRIGTAVARRLDAFAVPVVYFARHPQPSVPYRYYASLIEMARAADVLMLVIPGGPDTNALINATVLDALGPNGILINMARGSVVDEPALIAALQEGRIAGAGLDVYAEEPRVPPELLAMEQVVLLPHVGSASVHTRSAMGRLVVDNLIAWATGGAPLTPVPQTPWPAQR